MPLESSPCHIYKVSLYSLIALSVTKYRELNAPINIAFVYKCTTHCSTYIQIYSLWYESMIGKMHRNLQLLFAEMYSFLHLIRQRQLKTVSPTAVLISLFLSILDVDFLGLKKTHVTGHLPLNLDSN